MSIIARGDARMRQIGATNKARAATISKELLATLSRSPTPIDRAMALAVADATVRLENKIEQGRDSTMARRALLEVIAASPFAPASAPAVAPT